MATEAKDHIGEQATVCGKVVSTRYAESSRGSPTFLNFDQPYPNQVFTLLIWGSDRSKFGDPETSYRGKRICVTGKLTSFKGIPEVVASEPAQIKMKPTDWTVLACALEFALVGFLLADHGKVSVLEGRAFVGTNPRDER